VLTSGITRFKRVVDKVLRELLIKGARVDEAVRAVEELREWIRDQAEKYNIEEGDVVELFIKYDIKDGEITWFFDESRIVVYKPSKLIDDLKEKLERAQEKISALEGKIRMIEEKIEEIESILSKIREILSEVSESR